MRSDFLIFGIVVLCILAGLCWIWRKNFRTIHWLTIAISIGILPVTYYLADRTEQREQERLTEPLLGFAPTYAGEMARMGHSKITNDTPPDDPTYLQIIEAQKDWLKANPRVASIYSYRLDPSSEATFTPGDAIQFVVCAEVDYNRDGVYAGEDEERLQIGETYKETDQEMLDVLKGQTLFSGVPVEDNWGTWVAAYAPIYGPDGKVEAAVGVDFDAREWMQVLQRARNSVLAYAGLVFFMLVGAVAVTSSLLAQQSTRREAEVAAVTLDQKKKFETLVNSIEGVVFECDPQTGNFIFMSPQASRILGAPSLNWMGEGRWESCIHPDDRSRAQKARFAAMRQPGTYTLEYRFNTGPRTIWLRETGNTLQSSTESAVRGILTDITSQKKAAEELEMTHRRLVDTSRRAGMAEVATGVLHNVGNVLNSVNVASSLIHQRVNQTRISGLVQLGELLKSQGDSLSEFFRNDPRGLIIPDYLADLAGHLKEEQSAVLCEVGKLVKNVEHIKNIVDLQQSYARAGGVMETLDVVDLVEDAIGINSASLTRHRISIEKNYEPGPKLVCGDKSKILQILVNLIRNAKHAVDEGEDGNRQIRIFVRDDGQENLRVTVQDTGVGISADNMSKLFTHGFTTRKHGHGFGLHSSESAAREMGGTLTAQSDGPGQGASFTLELKSVHPQSPTSTRTPEEGAASHLVLSA